MNITLNGTKITQDTRNLAFEKNSNVDEIVITVDTDESWSYKLDVKYPNKYNIENDALYNIIDLDRNGNTCSVTLNSEMLPFNGKYTMQLRGINGDKVYHSDTFEVWVKYSIEPGSTYDPVPSEFYQVEARLDDKVDEAKQYAENAEIASTRMPKISSDNTWLIWDVDTGDYVDTGVKASGGGSGTSDHSLTFTGAVTGSYDGSAPLTVDIPAIDSTLTVKGKVADAKAVGDALSTLSGEIENLDVRSVEYKWVPRGLMREQVRTFQGWTHCVRYDERLRKAVGIVMAGEAAHTNEMPLYRVTIDDNGYMSDYEEIIVYDTDGSTIYTPNNGYVCGFCILSDGSYLIQDNDFTTDSTPNFYKSTDFGKTFVRLDIEGIPTQAFGLRQLSTGRIISGSTGAKNRFYYSDDLGVTWNESNVLDVSILGNPPFEANSTYEFAEHCIIEFSNGTLLAIGRTSNNARDVHGTVRGHLEGAAIAYSDDYGKTWRDFGWSKTITNMTGCNAACVCINGIYHLVVGDRYTYTTDELGNRRYFAMYYQYATEEDALNDNWSDPVVIDYGHWTSNATTPTDCGYPSLWKDAVNNLHCVFYDGDGSGTAYGANWRLIDGSPCVESRAVSDVGTSSLLVSYSQKQVEALLEEQRKSIMNVMMVYINDLYDKAGSLVPDSGENDGSNYITSNLLWYFNFVDTSLWSDDSKYVYPVYSASDISRTSAFSPILLNGYPTLSNANSGITPMTDNLEAKPFSGMGVDSTEGFSLEFCGLYKKSNIFQYGLTINDNTLRWDNAFHVPVITDGVLGSKSCGASRSFAENDIYHFIHVFTPTNIKVYCNGTMLGNAVAITEEQYEASKTLYVKTASQNTAYVTAIRLYNAPLTADQCMNNYKWFVNFVDTYTET